MKIPSFVRTKELASPADIEAIEEQYGFNLPDDYKAHLLIVNGGYPKPDRFISSVNGESATYVVNKFYSVKYGGSSALETALDDLRDQIHPDLVPFADDAGGDQFCLSVGREDYGSVYYISHESYVPPAFLEDEELEAQPRQYGQGVYFLAPSFTAFLEGLVEVPEEA